MLLKAEKIRKTFDSRTTNRVGVLEGVDLEIRAGERIAVLGKSGAGKSTLLHILGTLEQPTSGRVTFEGQDIFRFSESKLAAFRNRTLGFVFQFHYLMVEFSAVENVMMPALLGRVSQREARKRAEQLLEGVGLRDRLRHKPGQLSGGEQQRVAIARSLMMRPKLLLTDEMTGNLDPATGKQILDLLDDLSKDHPLAMVSVTHDEALASLYPRVLRLLRGTLVADAS